MAKKKWIPKNLKKGRCTPAPNPDCPVGSPQYNLAMTFKKNASKGGKWHKKRKKAEGGEVEGYADGNKVTELAPVIRQERPQLKQGRSKLGRLAKDPFGAAYSLYRGAEDWTKYDRSFTGTGEVKEKMNPIGMAAWDLNPVTGITDLSANLLDLTRGTDEMKKQALIDFGVEAMMSLPWLKWMKGPVKKALKKAPKKDAPSPSSTQRSDYQTEDVGLNDPRWSTPDPETGRSPFGDMMDDMSIIDEEIEATTGKRFGDLTDSELDALMDAEPSVDDILDSQKKIYDKIKGVDTHEFNRARTKLLSGKGSGRKIINPTQKQVQQMMGKPVAPSRTPGWNEGVDAFFTPISNIEIESFPFLAQEEKTLKSLMDNVTAPAWVRNRAADLHRKTVNDINNMDIKLNPDFEDYFFRGQNEIFGRKSGGRVGNKISKALDMKRRNKLAKGGKIPCLKCGGKIKGYEIGGPIPDTEVLGDDLSITNALRRMYYGYADDKDVDISGQLLRLNPVTQVARGASSLINWGLQPFLSEEQQAKEKERVKKAEIATNELKEYRDKLRKEGKTILFQDGGRIEYRRGGEIQGYAGGGSTTYPNNPVYQSSPIDASPYTDRNISMPELDFQPMTTINQSGRRMPINQQSLYTMANGGRIGYASGGRTKNWFRNVGREIYAGIRGYAPMLPELQDNPQFRTDLDRADKEAQVFAFNQQIDAQGKPFGMAAAGEAMGQTGKDQPSEMQITDDPSFTPDASGLDPNTAMRGGSTAVTMAKSGGRIPGYENGGYNFYNQGKRGTATSGFYDNQKATTSVSPGGDAGGGTGGGAGGTVLSAIGKAANVIGTALPETEVASRKTPLNEYGYDILQKTPYGAYADIGKLWEKAWTQGDTKAGAIIGSAADPFGASTIKAFGPGMSTGESFASLTLPFAGAAIAQGKRSDTGPTYRSELTGDQWSRGLTATGGRIPASLFQGGFNKSGNIKGPGTKTSDSIPMEAQQGFVVAADKVPELEKYKSKYNLPEKKATLHAAGGTRIRVSDGEYYIDEPTRKIMANDGVDFSQFRTKGAQPMKEGASMGKGTDDEYEVGEYEVGQYEQTGNKIDPLAIANYVGIAGTTAMDVLAQREAPAWKQTAQPHMLSTRLGDTSGIKSDIDKLINTGAYNVRQMGGSSRIPIMSSLFRGGMEQYKNLGLAQLDASKRAEEYNIGLKNTYLDKRMETNWFNRESMRRFRNAQGDLRREAIKGGVQGILDAGQQSKQNRITEEFLGRQYNAWDAYNSGKYIDVEKTATKNVPSGIFNQGLWDKSPNHPFRDQHSEKFKKQYPNLYR